MIGADAIVKCLEAEGVTTVFGYPGVAICPFYNSILDSDIRTILIRTEQNAAHAASGVARITGRPGVCAVTSGPGATNVITGIATAFADSIPLICITGQVNSELLGSDVFQEADITGAVESFVKYSYLVKDANEIPRVFKEAFHIANTGRKGPVLIDIPIDVQNAVIGKFKYPEEISLRTYKPTVKGNAVQIKKVVKELERAKHPIICAGGGVLLAEAETRLRSFAEKNGIPVVSTMMGIGIMPTKHPLYFGMVGNNGKAYANRAMNESDLLITDWSNVGYEFAFATQKPILFINTPPKVTNPNYTKLTAQPLDLVLRSKVGISLGMDELEKTKEMAAFLLEHREDYQNDILAWRQKILPQYGNSGKIGGKYILSRLAAPRNRGA